MNIYIYIYIYIYIGCCLEDLPEAIDDRDEKREKERGRESQGNRC